MLIAGTMQEIAERLNGCKNLLFCSGLDSHCTPTPPSPGPPSLPLSPQATKSQSLQAPFA